MSTFHNFAHKMKTGWVATVIKPILQTKHVDDKC